MSWANPRSNLTAIAGTYHRPFARMARYLASPSIETSRAAWVQPFWGLELGGLKSSMDHHPQLPRNHPNLPWLGWPFPLALAESPGNPLTHGPLALAGSPLNIVVSSSSSPSSPWPRERAIQSQVLEPQSYIQHHYSHCSNHPNHDPCLCSGNFSKRGFCTFRTAVYVTMDCVDRLTLATSLHRTHKNAAKERVPTRIAIKMCMVRTEEGRANYHKFGHKSLMMMMLTINYGNSQCKSLIIVVTTIVINVILIITVNA